MGAEIGELRVFDHPCSRYIIAVVGLERSSGKESPSLLKHHAMSLVRPSLQANELGIATLSLGNWRKHRLESRLEAAAKVAYQCIDLFVECWAAYLEEIVLQVHLM